MRLARKLSLVLAGISLLVSAALFAFATWFAWLAFTNPVELEIREGTIWLHAIAGRAGVDIYDATRVAFVNMAHGPMDVIFKRWITTAFPALPGHMVIRSFVLAFPFLLLASAYAFMRKNLAGALLAAGVLMLCFVHVARMTLVGRSDATAHCLLLGCFFLTHRLLVTRSRGWSSKAYVSKQILLGAISAVLFLTSWRFVPAIGALQVIVLAKQLSENNARWYKTAWVSSGLFMLGFAVVWVWTLVAELHGDLNMYYRRFFGFFLPTSGWGAVSGAQFELLPAALLEKRGGVLLAFAALIGLGLYRMRRERAQFFAWLVMLPAVWLVVAYGYFKNQLGGGLYYFLQFFELGWFFILHALFRRKEWRQASQVIALVVIACIFPWRDLVAHLNQLRDARARAESFMQSVHEITQGQPIFSEDAHLFKTEYHDEVVDAGDTVAAIAATGYFGPEFSRTFNSYISELQLRPPQFVLVGLLDEVNLGGISTPALRFSLRNKYTRKLIYRNSAVAYRGSLALFERRAKR